jgi:hypothetical protein
MEEAEKGGLQLLAIVTWHLAEKIHFRKGTVKHPWGSDLITRGALAWLSEGLFQLTSGEMLHHLYWLHSPTEIISPTLRERINTTRLLSYLSEENSKMNLSTYASQSFKSVEPYISTLSSGGYPRIYFFWSGKIVRLPKFGGTVFSISKEQMEQSDSLFT